MQHDDRISQELIALEKKYWNAIREKDSSTAALLSSDPCVVVGAQGLGEIDNATLQRMMKNATYELKKFTFDNVHVRRVTDDVAVVAYKVKEELVVDGKDLMLEAFDSSVWLHRDHRWVCVAHTESIAGDPYGRH